LKCVQHGSGTTATNDVFMKHTTKMKKFRLYSYPKGNPFDIRYGDILDNAQNPDGTTLADFWQKECDKYNTLQSSRFHGIEEVKP